MTERRHPSIPGTAKQGGALEAAQLDLGRLLVSEAATRPAEAGRVARPGLADSFPCLEQGEW